MKYLYKGKDINDFTKEELIEDIINYVNILQSNSELNHIDTLIKRITK